MNQRPELSRNLDCAAFRSFYYLKRELADFCKENGLPTSGSKAELTDRIAYFLDTGKEKKQTKTEIGGQFEYNTYIRDFFADNPGKSLHDAIVSQHRFSESNRKVFLCICGRPAFQRYGSDDCRRRPKAE